MVEPTTISYPTINNVLYFKNDKIFLKADDISVDQYCSERSYFEMSYIAEEKRYANDGAYMYMYYDSANKEWVKEFGFSKVVMELTVSKM